MIPQGTVGSNPTLSATSAYFLFGDIPKFGRRGAPAKGVGRELPAREFKSLCLRQEKHNMEELNFRVVLLFLILYNVIKGDEKMFEKLTIFRILYRKKNWIIMSTTPNG